MTIVKDSRDVRQQMVEKTRPTAEKYLNDVRYDWLRPRGRRRALVLGATLVIAAHSVLLWTEAPRLVTLVLMAGGWVSYSLLKWAVRGMADLPEDLIDERMNAVRDRQYRVAYTFLSAGMAAVLVVMWMAADATRIAWQPQAHHLESVFWAFLFFAMCLPSMLVAWTEREL
jgi:hypothetical protein